MSFVEVTPVMIELGDDNGRACPLSAFVPQHRRQPVDAVGGGDREERGVGGFAAPLAGHRMKSA